MLGILRTISASAMLFALAVAGVACGPHDCTNPSEHGSLSGQLSYVDSHGATVAQPQDGDELDIGLGGGALWVYGVFVDEQGGHHDYRIEVDRLSAGATFDLAGRSQVCVSAKEGEPQTSCSSGAGSILVRSLSEDCKDRGYCIESIDASVSIRAPWQSVTLMIDVLAVEHGDWILSACAPPG